MEIDRGDECPCCGNETDSLMQCRRCLGEVCEACMVDELCPHCEGSDPEEDEDMYGIDY